MKKLNLLFTALLLLCCVGTATAEEVTIDGIKYDVVTKAKVATVLAGETKYTGNIVIPESIEHNGVTCSVTSIGDYAFQYCKGLTSVVIPNSVTSIGNYAFRGCSGLTNVEIPNSVTSIGDYAFQYCSGLTSVEIPNSVTSIGSSAFSSCSGLTSVEIPNSVTSIGSSAFSSCSGLTSVVIPNSVTSIGDLAFYECKRLTSVVIGNSVTSIGYKAFYYCSSLTSIEIPNSVTSIGTEAFRDCTSLTSIEIPNSVTSIGSEAFRDCTGLTSIEIPNSVTRIANLAFSGCTGLTGELVIPNSVTSIGEYAFSSSVRLTNVEIPNSVTNIEKGAFYNCSGLTGVTIGSGVKYIYSEAFAKCSNLAEVYCLATSVPSTNAAAFKDSYPEYMTLHVPAEAINSYKTTAPWSYFGTFATLDGEDYVEPEVKVCATPVITYSNGKLSFECDTEGAEFVTDVTCSDIKKFYDSEINLSATYNITVYATATGHENSATVYATLCWIESENSDEGPTTDVINIPATAALITSANGTITVSTPLNDEEVSVYAVDGTFIGTAIIENGSATISTGLSKGTAAIVTIGEKSVKIAIN